MNDDKPMNITFTTWREPVASDRLVIVKGRNQNGELVEESVVVDAAVFVELYPDGHVLYASKKEPT